MKYYKTIIVTIVLVLTLSACEKDFLDKLPLDEISTAGYWKTTSDIELFVNQFYPSAFPVSGSDRYNFIFQADLTSEDMSYVEADARLRGSRVIPATGGWDYSRIRSLNIFFENYAKAESSFDEYKQFVGEAHFFRALFYFSLVKRYGDVPWIDKPLNTDSEELYAPRTPRNQVVDNIIADLDQAIDLMPSGKQENGTRLSKEIAMFFKSRVCLYEGTWEKYHDGDPFGVANADPDKYLELAVETAQAVMASGIYDIYYKGTPGWNYFFFADVEYGPNPEVLFWKKYDLALGLGHARQFQTTTGMSGGVGLTKSFVESYLCTDGKPIFQSGGVQNPLYQGDSNLALLAMNRDPRLKQTILTPGTPLQIDGADTVYFERAAIDQSAHTVCPTGFQIYKMLNFDPIHRASLSTSGVGYTGWIIMRYAEVLLNYAEAKAELGTLTQGDIDLSIKLLRDRVGMPNLDIASIETDPNWLFPDLSPVINEIRRERRIELVGEGFRWDDIARWAAADEIIVAQRPFGAKFNAIDYPDLNEEDYRLTDGYLDPLKDQLPSGYGFVLGRDYLTAISTEELTLNSLLVQNPGW
jgi:hypothetical protein